MDLLALARKRATNKMPPFWRVVRSAAAFLSRLLSAITCVFVWARHYSHPTHITKVHCNDPLCLCYKWQLVGNNSFIVSINFGCTLPFERAARVQGVCACGQFNNDVVVDRLGVYVCACFVWFRLTFGRKWSGRLSKVCFFPLVKAIVRYFILFRAHPMASINSEM